MEQLQPFQPKAFQLNHPTEGGDVPPALAEEGLLPQLPLAQFHQSSLVQLLGAVGLAAHNQGFLKSSLSQRS